jgi:transcription elongation factor Elf1
MYERRFDLLLTCVFCGHHNRLTIATVSLPDCHIVNCSVCGGALGTLGNVRGQPPQEAPDLRLAG